MKVGYQRTSTLEQVAGLEAQERDLRLAGVEKIFSEQLSSVDTHRAQLEAAIEFCREGDVLYCTRLDRLGRSVADIVSIEKRLRDKGAALHIMDPAMDTSTPAGRLAFNVIAAVAQFEREIMLARQREGIAKAKADGRYKGRAPTAQAKAAEIRELLAQGLTDAEAAKRAGISVRSLYRIKKAKAVA